MSDWMEYCNLSVGKWARLRKQNGHAEPYNVKYWSVGNENWGRHELGARTVQEWGPLHHLPHNRVEKVSTSPVQQISKLLPCHTFIQFSAKKEIILR